MFCHNCGKQIPEGTKFCHHCGAAQNKVQGAPASSAPSPARTAQANNQGQQDKSSGNGMFAKILSIAIIAIAGYIIFFYDTNPAATPASGSSSQPSFAIDPVININTKSQDSVPTPQPTTPTPVVDNRIPDYQQTNPQWELLRYEWYCLNNSDIMWLEVPIDAQMYACYRNLERYMGIGYYYQYIVDENNREIIREIVRVLQDVGDDLSYTDMDMIREIVRFVQDAIEYEYDITSTGEIEYPRYPIETLYERRGDCEDTSILLAALLKEMGYEVGFLHLPNHLAVAVRAVDDYNSSAYYEINGHRYVYIESTGSGWNIGDIPEDFQQAEAEFYLIP